MTSITTKIISGVLIVFAIFSGVMISWEFGKDWVELKSDGTTIAKEKWVVSAERTWSTIKYPYQKDTCLKKGGTIKEYANSPSRCYYPANFYETLSRSLINTKITQQIKETGVDVIKQSPFYMYGTTGAYAGHVTETMFFSDPTLSEKQFPLYYNVNWAPKDTRNYKVVWRIEGLKEINLPNGEYHLCNYEFGKIFIDITPDCDKLDKAIISGQSKIYFYFKSARGVQSFTPTLVDPIYQPDITINISLTNHVKYNNWSEWQNVTYINETCEWNETNSSWMSCPYYVNEQFNYSVVLRKWQTLTAENDTYSNTMNVTEWCGRTIAWDDGIDRIFGKSYLDGGRDSLEGFDKPGRSYFWVNYTTAQPVIFYTEDYYGDCYLANLQELVGE